MKRNLDYTVVKSVNKEDGPKIVEFYKLNGYNTNNLVGSSYENFIGDSMFYYGCIAGVFSQYSQIVANPEFSPLVSVLPMSEVDKFLNEINNPNLNSMKITKQSLNNTCIKVNEKGDGKTILKFYKSYGYDVECFDGSYDYGYYGVENDSFTHFLSENYVGKCTILPLNTADQLYCEYPKEMYVCDMEIDDSVKRIETIIGEGITCDGMPYYISRSDTTLNLLAWKYAKDIHLVESKPVEVIELTLKEIADKLNMDVNQLRIKE